MANHGRSGAALVEYHEKRVRPRTVQVPNAKTGKIETVRTTGRYNKPSYLKRAESRSR